MKRITKRQQKRNERNRPGGKYRKPRACEPATCKTAARKAAARELTTRKPAAGKLAVHKPCVGQPASHKSAAHQSSVRQLASHKPAVHKPHECRPAAKDIMALALTQAIQSALNINWKLTALRLRKQAMKSTHMNICSGKKKNKLMHENRRLQQKLGRKYYHAKNEISRLQRILEGTETNNTFKEE